VITTSFPPPPPPRTSPAGQMIRTDWPSIRFFSSFARAPSSRAAPKCQPQGSSVVLGFFFFFVCCFFVGLGFVLLVVLGFFCCLFGFFFGFSFFWLFPRRPTCERSVSPHEEFLFSPTVPPPSRFINPPSPHCFRHGFPRFQFAIEGLLRVFPPLADVHLFLRCRSFRSFFGL